MRAKSMRPIPVLFLVAVLVLAGCSSHYLAVSSVPLAAPLGEFCFKGVIASEDGVREFRQIPQNDDSTYWFRIDLESASGDDAPAFMAVQRTFEERWKMEIETGFVGAPFTASRLQREVLERQRTILSRVFSLCSARTLRFGPERPCGKGEGHTVCVEAEAVPKGEAR